MRLSDEMIKLNQIKVGTVVYDKNKDPLKIAAIDYSNRFWWDVLCEVTTPCGWAPNPRLVNEYGLSSNKRYYGYSLELFEELLEAQCQCHTYEYEVE